SSPTSALQSTFSPGTQGNMALAIAPTGYTTITSLPMTAIGPVDPELKLDLWVPSSQPNPNRWGTVQLSVTLPSRGLHNHYIGEHELTGKQQDAFNTLSFTLTSELQAALNSSNYSDLTFTIALNVPEGAAVHYVDNIQVGTVTRPAEPALASP